MINLDFAGLVMLDPNPAQLDNCLALLVALLVFFKELIKINW